MFKYLFNTYEAVEPPAYNHPERKEFAQLDYTLDDDSFENFQTLFTSKPYSALNYPGVKPISKNNEHQSNEDSVKDDLEVILQNIPKPKGDKFVSKSDFIKSMVACYKKALSDNGLDPEYAYILTSVSAHESGWGKHTAGTFNYGGITITLKLANSGVSHTPRIQNSKKYNYKNFTSVQDYCNYSVRMLKNSSRYSGAFKYTPSQPFEFWRYVLTHGYAEANPDVYMRSVKSIYNSIRK